MLSMKLVVTLLVELSFIPLNFRTKAYKKKLEALHGVLLEAPIFEDGEQWSIDKISINKFPWFIFKESDAFYQTMSYPIVNKITHGFNCHNRQCTGWEIVMLIGFWPLMVYPC